jgi:hypothetical protein
MPWDDICTDTALDRAQRAIAAMLGNISNDDVEPFATEIAAIIDEIQADGEECTRLLSCVAAITAVALRALSQQGLEIDGPGYDAFVGIRQLNYLDTFSQILRDLAAEVI